MTENPGMWKLYYDEYCHNKEVERWGWSFHVPLCNKVSYIFLYDIEVKHIQKVRIHFLCPLDVSHSGFGGTKGNLRLHGSFHSNPHENRIDLDYFKPRIVGKLNF